MFSLPHSEKFRAERYTHVLMVGELGKCALQRNVRHSLSWSPQEDQGRGYDFSVKKTTLFL